MKIGLISDVHGDSHALRLALARLKDMGADRIVCCGDLVGYGKRPDDVIAIVKEEQIPCVRGNHDRWALERGSGKRDPFGGPIPSDETLAFLAYLPENIRMECEGLLVLFVHGSPYSDMEFINAKEHFPARLNGWLEDIRCDVLVHGHTHKPMLCRTERGLVINPGSVVRDAKTDTSHSFALLELPALKVTHYDIEYGREVPIGPWTQEKH
jgi:putative phosphoesterase